MKEEFIKDQLIQYAETIIAPALVENIERLETISDTHGDTNIWLLYSDTGEEYWVLEGDQPSNIYRRSGIYQDINHVYDAYIAMLEERDEPQEIMDRSLYM